MRILIVDDHPAMRAGLRHILSTKPAKVKELVRLAIQSIAEAETAAETLEQLRLDPDINVILLDYSLPDIPGVELTKEILRLYPKVRIVLYCGIEDEYVLVAAVQAGVRGAITKGEPVAVVIAALRAVQKGCTYLSPIATNLLMRVLFKERKFPSVVKALSPGEGNVLRLIALGLGNKQIAGKLELKENTIRTLRARLYKKLHAGNSGEVLRAAGRLRLLEKED